MGKNLDTDNIFGSYMNNVLLKEAVKPTETTTPVAPLSTQERAYADSAKAQGKNLTDAQAKLMFAQEQGVKAQADAAAKAGGTTSQTSSLPNALGSASKFLGNVGNFVKQAGAAQQPQQQQGMGGIIGGASKLAGGAGNLAKAAPTNTQPAPQTAEQKQKHEDDVKRFLGELPEETGDTETHSAKEIQDWMDTNSKEMETQNPGLKGNWVNTSGEPIDDSSEDMGEPVETTSIAAGDDEFEQNDEESVKYTPEKKETEYTSKKDETEYTPKKDETVYKSEKIEKKFGNISEKRNISKFLRHLSEKNYSTAHKYLKAVLNSKINNIVAERINKNFN